MFKSGSKFRFWMFPLLLSIRRRKIGVNVSASIQKVKIDEVFYSGRILPFFSKKWYERVLASIIRNIILNFVLKFADA